MTREEFSTLRRGSVVQWIDGMIGVVKAAHSNCAHIAWENGVSYVVRVDEVESIRLCRMEAAA